MHRRRLLTLTPALWLASLGGLSLACRRPAPAQAPDQAPPGQGVEVSAVLELDPGQLGAPGPQHHRIHGQGHTHSVELDDESLARLRAQGSALVRSGPGGDDGHRHWVRVRLGRQG